MTVVPVRPPVPAQHQLGGIHRTTIKERDFFRMRGIGKIEYRDAALIPGLRHDVTARYGNEGAVVCDAILCFSLSNGKLVVASGIEIVAGTVEDCVRAP